MKSNVHLKVTSKKPPIVRSDFSVQLFQQGRPHRKKEVLVHINSTNTMNNETSVDQIYAWIDEELVDNVNQVPDEEAIFNLAIEMSNIIIHVVRRTPTGPLIVGQQIEYDDQIRSRIQELSRAEKSDLVTRIRETLTSVPGVYGFHDRKGNNVKFEDMHRVFLEHRIYSNTIDQQVLMNSLIDVWKALRYLDDIMALIDSVENQPVE